MSSSSGTPNFANGVPIVAEVVMAANAQTGFSGLTTGSSNVNLLRTGANANGERINRLWWMPTATCAAGVINFFHNPSSTTLILIGSILVPANTLSTTSAPNKLFCPDLVGFVLPNAQSLYVATTIAQAGVAGFEGAPF